MQSRFLISDTVEKPMAEFKLQGSGGYIMAELTEEQAKKADLGVGKLFLAPIGKLEVEKMSKHYCNVCETEFNSPPKIQLEESPDEEVAENLVLQGPSSRGRRRAPAGAGEPRPPEASRIVARRR